MAALDSQTSALKKSWTGRIVGYFKRRLGSTNGGDQTGYYDRIHWGNLTPWFSCVDLRLAGPAAADQRQRATTTRQRLLGAAMTINWRKILKVAVIALAIWMVLILVLWLLGSAHSNHG